MQSFRKTRKKKLGGRVIASGGFGCVFSPALKCENVAFRSKNKISKLMVERYAIEEYEEIQKIKKKVDSIPRFEDYFLLSDISICRPAKLEASDLEHYSKCTALPKNKITAKNINNSLHRMLSLNIPNGGLPVDDFMLTMTSGVDGLYELHSSLVQLLRRGILEMNKRHIYHCDIKDSNVLVDDTNGTSALKTRLIDWGLSTEYVPFVNQSFPSTWRNRPFQFNVPFSVILFSDDFVKQYTDYLQHRGAGVGGGGGGGGDSKKPLRAFVLQYVKHWMKSRGKGHYDFIAEFIQLLLNPQQQQTQKQPQHSTVDTEEMDALMDDDKDQLAIQCIIDYIVDVLTHFTKFKHDGTLNLRIYLDNVFIRIVDIWGFLSIYFPFAEWLATNYSILTPSERKLFHFLQQNIIVKYMFAPRHEEINMNRLFKDLNTFGRLIQISNKQEQKTIRRVSANVKNISRRKTGKNKSKNKSKSKSKSEFE